MEETSYSKAFYLLLVCITARHAPTCLAQRKEQIGNFGGGKILDNGLRHAIQEILNQNGGDTYVDPCASAPCLNAGKCTVTSYSALTFRCHCVSGYTGLKCERGQNECLSSPCRHGTCVDHIGSFSCRCDLGFAGVLCEQDINECASSPCLNGGSCEQGMPGRFTCKCPRGFRGMRCQTDIDECLSLSPCQNGGACQQEGPGRYSCSCLPGFSGRDCEHVLDPCTSNPCLNSGQCLHDPNSDTTDTWQCRCAPGYNGVRCEQEVNPCLVQSPCGQGECQPLSGGQYRCQCPPGVTGSHCETVTNPCLSRPCLNGARCVNPSAGRYRCRCHPDFKGRNCQTSRPVCDVTRFKCQNGGSCLSNSGGRPSCLCPEGFSGSKCEFKFDPCESRPCSSNATCRRSHMPEGFRCLCQKGFSGAKCHDVDATTPRTTSTTTTTTAGQGNTTQEDDGDHVHAHFRPIDPTLLFILLGMIGSIALLIGIALLFIKLIGCQKPRDFCFALPWSLFNGLEPRIIGPFGAWEPEHDRGKQDSLQVSVSHQDGSSSSPSLMSVYESPKPLADYTFRRY